jgi:hypothetical protein
MDEGTSRAFASLRARIRAGIALEASSTLATALLLYVATTYVADRTLELERAWRAALLVLAAVALAVVVRRRLLGPLATRLGDDELALALERAHPDLRQALISGVQFATTLSGAGDAGTRNESAQMMREVVARARGEVGGLRVGRALDSKRAAKTRFTLALALLGLVVPPILLPGEFAIWVQRDVLLQDTRWPSATQLEFLGGASTAGGVVLRVAAGDDLEIRVRATGVIPERVRLQWHGGRDDRDIEVAMQRLGGGAADAASADFAYLLEDVLDSWRVVAVGGDGRSVVAEVVPVPRPALTDVRARVVPPSYLATEPVVVDPSLGPIRVPEGGTVELEAAATKAIATVEAELRGDGAATIALTETRVGPTPESLSVRFAPERGGTLVVGIRDLDGLDARPPFTTPVEVAPDRPPEVRYETKRIGSMITRQARVPGVLVVRDDHAVASVAAELAIGSVEDPEAGEARWEPAPVEGLRDVAARSSSVEAEPVLDLLSLPEDRRSALEVGALVSLRFRAEDRREPEPGVGVSEVARLRIVSREELQVDLARRRAEIREELERLLEGVLSSRSIVAIGDPTDELELALARNTLEERLRAGLATLTSAGERFAGILDETLANRLYEPQVVARTRRAVVERIERLARDAMPVVHRQHEPVRRRHLHDEPRRGAARLRSSDRRPACADRGDRGRGLARRADRGRPRSPADTGAGVTTRRGAARRTGRGDLRDR